MASTFRSRLFRLLLFFAVVPSILLTLVGYYLVFDSGPVEDLPEQSSSDSLSEYLTEALYRGVTEAVARPDSIAVRGLDFLAEFTSDRDSVLKSDGTDLAPLLDRLREYDPALRQVIVSIDGTYYQCVLEDLDSGWRRVGGIVHDSTFALLAEQARRSSAAELAGRELKSKSLVFLALMLLAVASLTIVAAYFFSSRVSRNLAEPVAALSLASHQIAGGDFKQKISSSAEGEIGQLIRSFNRMAEQLDQMTARLSQTERVAAWRQVARRFAHELKNPLQPILVSLYRLEKQLAGSDMWEQVNQPLRAAREEVQHLTLLAERFSSLAKLPPPTITSVELNSLVISTVELYCDELQPCDFRVELPSENVSVDTDAGYLREALHNLLQNAIDACPPGAGITVTVEIGRGGPSLTVADSGVGMNASTLSSARLPYFTTKAKGNGLGLAIVERSMAELGGRLTVESEEGKGTRVTIHLAEQEA